MRHAKFATNGATYGTANHYSFCAAFCPADEHAIMAAYECAYDAAISSTDQCAQ